MKSCKTDRKVRFENPNPRFCFKKRHFASEKYALPIPSYTLLTILSGLR